MSQNTLYSSLRRFAWRMTPAPILNIVFGDRLSGMGQLIEQANIVSARRVTVPDVQEPCYPP